MSKLGEGKTYEAVEKAVMMRMEQYEGMDVDELELFEKRDEVEDRAVEIVMGEHNSGDWVQICNRRY